MTARLSWLRPALSLVMLALILAMAWMGLVRPVADWRMARFSAHTASVSETERLSVSVDRLKRDLAQLSQKEDLDLIWSAQEIGEVTAQVQASISAMARETGISLRSVTPGNAPDFPFVKTVGFRLEGEARLDQLLSFLRALEGANPALVVERAHLRRLNRVGEATELPVLFLQLELMAPVRVAREASE